jgi:hypothetical protein
LNQDCAFALDLELMLLGDSPQNPSFNNIDRDIAASTTPHRRSVVEFLQKLLKGEITIQTLTPHYAVSSNHQHGLRAVTNNL